MIMKLGGGVVVSESDCVFSTDSFSDLWGNLDRFFFINLHHDQQMPNYFTNYHTATCFDTIVSSCHADGQT